MRRWRAAATRRRLIGFAFKLDAARWVPSDGIRFYLMAASRRSSRTGSRDVTSVDFTDFVARLQPTLGHSTHVRNVDPP